MAQQRCGAHSSASGAVVAGIEKINFKDKFVAIKIHFGELGNLAFLRPNYATVVADVLKFLRKRKA